MYSYNVIIMWVMLATVAFKLLRKSGCVPQFYVRRIFTHVHGCQSSHLETATRSTKTTIVTVHVNTIMQAAPSQRRIISISEASCCFTPRIFSLRESDGGLNNFLPQIVFTVQETAARREAEQLRVSQSRSTETVDKLQPGRKPNSFTFRNPGQPRRSK